MMPSDNYGVQVWDMAKIGQAGSGMLILWKIVLTSTFKNDIYLIRFACHFCWFLIMIVFVSMRVIDTKLSGSRCFAGWKWFKWSKHRTKWQKKLYIITGSFRASLLSHFQSPWRFCSIFFSRYNKYVSVHHFTNPYTGSLVQTFLVTNPVFISAVRLWSTKLNANLVCYKGHNYPVWDAQV